MRKIDIPAHLIEVLSEIENIPGLKSPEGKKQIKRLSEILQQANKDNPIQIYAGSCPGYSVTDGKYDHKSLTSDIPYLSQLHLSVDSQLLQILDTYNIPFIYKILIADVEAIDDYFVKKYTNGDVNQFLEICKSSQDKTKNLITESFPSLERNMISSSFFEEFGYDNFMHYYDLYYSLLLSKYQEDNSFRNRVIIDTNARMNMYLNMYENYAGSNKINFLVTRTIRTMAQYLTLARIMQLKTSQAIIMNHPTVNIGLYNDLNRFKFSESDPDFRAIPVFTLEKEVY